MVNHLRLDTAFQNVYYNYAAPFSVIADMSRVSFDHILLLSLSKKDSALDQNASSYMKWFQKLCRHLCQ